MVSIESLTIFCPLLYEQMVFPSFTAYPHCCRGYITGKLPYSAIKGYSVQTDTEMCPINAIIFHTKKGKACANPALKWVIDAINRIRKKAQRIHQHSSQLQM
uniref:C-C motif chemokine n=1 Tax=Maylandia zebra TaxID=106582 RepID=A0A3P9CT97_9CICH